MQQQGRVIIDKDWNEGSDSEGRLCGVSADTIIGFIEAAKARPQAIANYGSAGTGTVFHLTGELFKRLTGLALQHVPYRGGAPTVTALLAGEIPLALDHVGAAAPYPRWHAARARGYEPAAQRYTRTKPTKGRCRASY